MIYINNKKINNIEDIPEGIKEYLSTLYYDIGFVIEETSRIVEIRKINNNMFISKITFPFTDIYVIDIIDNGKTYSKFSMDNKVFFTDQNSKIASSKNIPLKYRAIFGVEEL